MLERVPWCQWVCDGGEEEPHLHVSHLWRLHRSSSLYTMDRPVSPAEKKWQWSSFNAHMMDQPRRVKLQNFRFQHLPVIYFPVRREGVWCLLVHAPDLNFHSFFSAHSSLFLPFLCVLLLPFTFLIFSRLPSVFNRNQPWTSFYWKLAKRYWYLWFVVFCVLDFSYWGFTPVCQTCVD